MFLNISKFTSLVKKAYKQSANIKVADRTILKALEQVDFKKVCEEE